MESSPFLILIVIGVLYFLWMLKDIIPKPKSHSYNYRTESSKNQRGDSAERNLVHTLRNNGIPSETIFHDLYLNTYRNYYSQIDLVVPTKVGIIVFEVKDFSGWIFGTGKQRQWTQVLNYGADKYRFYNPVQQNLKHIKQLQKKLPREQVPYFSIIVFYGDCELRDVSYIPKNTYLAKPHTAHIAFKEILHENPPANYTDKRNILNVLQQAVDNGANQSVREQHVHNIREQKGKHRIFH